MRPDIEIAQLTRYQFGTLKRLANGRTKAFAAISGIPEDRAPGAISLLFNETLNLVEWGLAVDETNNPKWDKIVKDNTKEEGRQCVVVVLNGRGQMMFQRQTHDKWVN